VREALSNLVDNALRHGGVHVVVRTREEAGSVRLDVEDDGRGLDRSERSSVFGRFVRGGSEAAGTGLGLWLVDRVARAHGGSVDVRSERGRGCTFTLVLPMRPPGAEAAGEATEARA
jgi:two-component system osmolarity sensor histidine kinase EnvZ